MEMILKTGDRKKLERFLELQDKLSSAMNDLNSEKRELMKTAGILESFVKKAERALEKVQNEQKKVEPILDINISYSAKRVRQLDNVISRLLIAVFAFKDKGNEQGNLAWKQIIDEKVLVYLDEKTLYVPEEQ